MFVRPSLAGDKDLADHRVFVISKAGLYLAWQGQKNKQLVELFRRRILEWLLAHGAFPTNRGVGAVQTIYSQLDFNFELCCGFADANQGLRLKIPKTHFDWIDKARIQKLQLLLQLMLVSQSGSVNMSASLLCSFVLCYRGFRVQGNRSNPAKLWSAKDLRILYINRHTLWLDLLIFMALTPDAPPPSTVRVVPPWVHLCHFFQPCLLAHTDE